MSAESRKLADVRQCLIDLAHVFRECTGDGRHPIERRHIYVPIWEPEIGKSRVGSSVSSAVEMNNNAIIGINQSWVMKSRRCNYEHSTPGQYNSCCIGRYS